MTGTNAGAPSGWSWLDGRVLPTVEAQVRADDQGLLGGLGVYETTRAIGDRPFAITRHLARLHDAASRLAIPVPIGDAALADACAQVISRVRADAPTAELIRVRVTLTAGPGGPDARPTLLVTATPGGAWPPTAQAITVTWTVNEHSALAGVKCTSRAHQALALRAAQAAGADEAVMANTTGALCEGSASNIFLEVDGRLCTPSLSTGCLPGVTRALLLDLVPVDERDDLTFEHLHRSREAFLTSATRDVHPLRMLDGRALAEAPGPLTSAAAEAYSALVASTADP